MAYSIGDVSRVLGMTASALHYYEKEGIIDTPKVESGRRYYEDADINRLVSAKKYRAMGVAVRDIAQQFSADGMTGDQVIARMRERREEAARMAREYAGLVQDIDRLIDVGEQALGVTGAVDIRRMEDMLVFLTSSGGMIPQNASEQNVVKRWLEAMPAACVGICRGMEMERAEHGMVIRAQRAKDFALEADAPGVRRIPGGMALHAVVICGEEQYQDPDTIFKPVLTFAREHRFAQKDMMWGEQIFVDCSQGIRRHYYDIYMPFE